MAPTPDREQEQSIKERKYLLYEDDPVPSTQVAGKPFREFLNETPAAPLSGGMKAILWAVAVAVGLLLLGAMYRMTKPPAKPDAKADSAPAPNPSAHLS